MSTAWSRKETRENRPTDGGFAARENSAQRHPEVIVEVQSRSAPGIQDLLVFFAGISSIVMVWAILLIGRMAL